MSVKLLNTPSQTTAQTPFQDVLPTNSQPNSKQTTANNIQLPGMGQTPSSSAAAPQKALNCCDIFDWLRRKIGPMPLPFPLPNPRLPFPKLPTPAPRDPREPGLPKGGPVVMPRPLPPAQRPAPYLRPIGPINNGFKLPTVPNGAMDDLKHLSAPGQLDRLIKQGRAHAFEPNIDLAWVPSQNPGETGYVKVPYSEDSRVASVQLVSSDGQVLATADMPPLSVQLKTPGSVTVDFGQPLQSFPPNVRIVVTYRPVDANGQLGRPNQVQYLDVPDPTKTLLNQRGQVPTMTWRDPEPPREPGPVNLLPETAIPFEPTGRFSWRPPLAPGDRGSVTVPVREGYRATRAQIISGDGSKVLGTVEIPVDPMGARLRPGTTEFSFDEALSSFPPGSKLVVTYQPQKSSEPVGWQREVRYFEIQDPNQPIRNY